MRTPRKRKRFRRDNEMEIGMLMNCENNTSPPLSVFLATDSQERIARMISREYIIRNNNRFLLTFANLHYCTLRHCDIYNM